MRSIILLLLVLSMPQVLSADGLYNGLNADGYVFRDGLWYQGNNAFVRSRKTFSFYDGHRQCLTTKFIYNPAPAALVGEPIEGWRKELLDLKASRDKWEADIRASQTEQEEFLETVRALGLGDYYGLTAEGAYGQAQSQAGQYLQHKSTSYKAPLAAQGNTVYGYDQFAQTYPDVDLQVLYNQANNLAKTAQSLTSEATADFSALVYQEGKRQEGLATILAKGRVAAQVLQSLQDTRAEVHVDEWLLRRDKRDGQWEVVPKEEPTPSHPTPAQPTVGSDDVNRYLDNTQKRQLFALIANSCLECHSPDKSKGGLDMTKFLSFDVEKRRKIVSRLVADDPEKRMPLATGGTPGKSLEAGEIDLFFSAAGLRRKE